MADEVIIESDDSFLQKKLPKYEGGKTLEQKIKEREPEEYVPQPLPRPDSLDD